MKLKKIDINRCAKAQVTFDSYRSGTLYYKTIDGDIFPVPTSDLGTANVSLNEKGVFLMRWMKKFNDWVELCLKEGFNG